MRSHRVLAFHTLLALVLLNAPPVHASFHLNEITKVMVGLNGNNTIQAVELKMLLGGENLLTGVSIRVYDAAGLVVDSLGTFTSSVPSGVAGRAILCATENFAAAFHITPDLVIKPGLLEGTGQVSFEKPGCLVDAIAYGAVTTPKVGTTTAPPLSSTDGTVLVRTVDDALVPNCPLGEDAAARFMVASATSGSPVVFRNNANELAQVFPTASGVDETPIPPPSLRVDPNPFTQGARIIASRWAFLAVYDVQGRMVRSWGSRGAMPAVMGPLTVDWNGSDSNGRPLPSGIYFVQSGAGADAGARVRVILVR